MNGVAEGRLEGGWRQTGGEGEEAGLVEEEAAGLGGGWRGRKGGR